MKARTPKLDLRHLSIESANVLDFIRNECATYTEAAEFFGCDRSTVDRWMMQRVKPHPAAVTAVALWHYTQKLELALKERKEVQV